MEDQDPVVEEKIEEESQSEVETRTQETVSSPVVDDPPPSESETAATEAKNEASEASESTTEISEETKPGVVEKTTIKETVTTTVEEEITKEIVREAPRELTIVHEESSPNLAETDEETDEDPETDGEDQTPQAINYTLTTTNEDIVKEAQKELEEERAKGKIVPGDAVHAVEGPSSVQAVTFEGDPFKMPKTKNPISVHLSPLKWKGIDYLKNASVLNFFLLFLPIPGWFFIVWFMFWRLMYNVGLGWILHEQSNRRTFTKQFERVLKASPPFISKFIKKVITDGMYDDYRFEECPVEFNAWLFFRIIVDVVLANDLACYAVMCLKFFEFPGFSLRLLGCYLLGGFLCGFTLWAKTDAYRVVKDFAWYWGDFFFLLKQSLTFDRVFGIAPHPMYTIGYSFFYGASLITQSYTVFYVSLLAHFCQLIFLHVVENPHIKKTYPDLVEEQDPEKRTILYDKQVGYFRRDLIIFKNFDPWRSSDIFMALIIAYSSILTFCNLHPAFYILQVIVWRVLHSFGLGYILHKQSDNQAWVLSFLKRGATKQEAFENWKKIYNLSNTMTWVSFISCAFALMELPYLGSLIEIEGFLTKFLCGGVLLAINLWSSVSTYEALGEFGWFYGDFFIEEYPSTLYYTGIYRFLNNPECVTGFAGFFGLAVISGSWVCFALALFSQIANWIFTEKVERVHMKKLYGGSVRSKSGVTQEFTKILEDSEQGRKLLTKVRKVRRKVKTIQKQASMVAKQKTEEFVMEAKQTTEKLVKEAKEKKEQLVREAKQKTRELVDKVKEQAREAKM